MIPLRTTDIEASHYVRLYLTAHPPAGTTLDDVMTPTYWANVSYRMKPGTIIEVLSEDNSLDCELRVLEVGPTFATVRLLRLYTPPATAATVKADPEEVEVAYAGKGDRWRFIHRGQVIKSGFETRAEAEKAAEEYRGKIAA